MGIQLKTSRNLTARDGIAIKKGGRAHTPEDFRFFVDACHAAGIGLLLDWVPSNFPTDPQGL
jgi:hypothetical protein